MVMDSRALLDYALFQLTPTRTRCDLVIFAGKKNEKVASGLLEPFLSHLKSAKDEISKGGYSITLKPPSENSPWFTKATLERFVRFVSTPEVLERFVTIEREIDQIERSIESDENGTAVDVTVTQGNASTSMAGVGQNKSKYESNGSIDAEAEENPKIRLQRVLESRKAMLKKEQAMAYARALVAGFEMDDILDLASFSDVFGAHRLREACINFMELCNKKNDDKIWMDEVAAMQASYFGTPGIPVPGANTDLSQTFLAKSSTSESITGHGSLDTSEGAENALPIDFNPQSGEGSAQTPIWPHYLPPYMHNAQGPVFQHMPPYPGGYVFPGMSGAPSHYPGNALWPTNFHEFGMYPDRDIKDSLRYKSSTKKREKPTNHARPYSMSNGESVEESDAPSSRSNSSTEQEFESKLHSQEGAHGKKLKRRSSKKVVIRNINYITSRRKEDSSSGSDSSSGGEDEYVDAGSLKQQVEAAVVSVKRHQKPNSNKNKKGSNKSKIDLGVENDEATGKKDGTWDIFQNLLMRDSDPMSSEMDSKTIQVQEEYSIQKGIEGDTLSLRKFDKPKYGNDDPVLTERSIGNRMEKTDIKFEGEEHFHGVIKRSSKDEELLIPERVEGEYYLQNSHFGRESPIIKSQKEEDWILSSKLEVSASANHNIFQGDQSSDSTSHGAETQKAVILDDSFMVQSRLSDSSPQNQPKADIFVVSDIIGANEYGSNVQENMQGKVESSNYNEPEDLYMMLRRDSTPEQAVVATWSPEMDYGKDVSLVETADMGHKDNADAPPLRGGNKTNARNSKKQGAEVDRKVAKPRAPSGYLARSKSDVPLRSKMSSAGRSNAEKEEEKRKKTEELLLQRQKRIAERSAAKGVTSKTSTRSLNESKDSVSTNSESNMSRKPVMRSSTIDRLAAPRAAHKQVPTESKTGQGRKPTPKGNSAKSTPPSKKTNGTPKKQGKFDITDKNASDATNKERVLTGTVPTAPEESGNGEAIDLRKETEDFGDVKVLHTITSVEKRETNTISMEDALNGQISARVLADNQLLLPEDPPKQVEMPVNTNDHLADTPQVTVYPAIQNNLKSSDTNIHEKKEEKKKISFSPQISVMNISTPPSDNEANPELNHSRKKWNNGEGSPKVPKGFRKLLMFGRRT